MNSVQAIYERDIGVTFTIVFQNAWDTANDPYSANDYQGILNEFQTYWNNNFSNHPRDMAHLAQRPWAKNNACRCGKFEPHVRVDCVSGIICS